MNKLYLSDALHIFNSYSLTFLCNVQKIKKKRKSRQEDNKGGGGGGGGGGRGGGRGGGADASWIVVVEAEILRDGRSEVINISRLSVINISDVYGYDKGR